MSSSRFKIETMYMQRNRTLYLCKDDTTFDDDDDDDDYNNGDSR